MIERGEPVPWWRVWLLNARAVSGWGRDIPEIQEWSRFYALGAKMWPVLLSALLVVRIVVAAAQSASWRQFQLSEVVRSAISKPPLFIVPLLPILIPAVLIVLHRRRAEAGVRTQPTSISGECFAAAANWRTLNYYALIGPVRQQAQWFLLPLSWDTTVEPCADQFAVSYNPATGFVSEVKRMGAQPRTLPADEVEEPAPDDLKSSRYGDATNEQRRQLLRMARQGGFSWGERTGSLLGQSILLLLTAVFCFVIAFVVFTSLRTNGHVGTSSDDQTATVASCVLAAIGVSVFVVAAHPFRAWRRFRRADALGPTILEGDLICYTLLGVQFDSVYGKNVLALITRTGDDEQIVVCVPPKLQHRLWAGPGRVRIVYNPVSGRVFDLRHLPASPTPA